MAINALIAAGIRPPDVGDWGEAQGRAMTLRQMAQQGALQDMALQEKQREAELEAKRRAVFQKAGNDPGAVVRELNAIGDGKGAAAFASVLEQGRKSRLENDENEYKLLMGRAKDAAAQLSGVTDLPSLQRAVRWAHANKSMTDDEANAWLQKPWDETTQQEVRQFATQIQDAVARSEEARKSATDAHNAQMRPLQVRTATAGADAAEADALTKEMGVAERTMPTNSDSAAQDWAAWHATLPPQLRVRISPTYSEVEAQRIRHMAMPRAERATLDQRIAEFDESRRHNQVTEDLTRRGQNITLQGQEKADARAREGTQAAGKLGESAVQRIAEFRSAIGELGSLKKLLGDNKGYMGPVAGRSFTMWPGHDAQKVQAAIDRVRQRVGKALEGGVLRKEDEEKYKKILPTMADTPDIAAYKLDQLTETMNRDLSTFVSEQERAGRRVNTGSADPLGIR